jgi:hypothetical protein
MTRHPTLRSPAPVVAAFTTALAATTAGTIAAGAPTGIVTAACVGALGVAVVAGFVWLGKPTAPAPKEAAR